MYFIPRNNRFYFLLITSSQPVWYGATFAAFFILALFWLTMLYMPLQRYCMRLTIEQQDLIQKQVVVTQAQHEITALSQENDQLRSSLQRTAHEYRNYKIVLSAILLKGLETNLSMISCLPTAPTDKTWYSLHPVEIQSAGSFEQIMRYIQILETYNHHMHIQDMHITRQQDGLLQMVCHVLFLEVRHEDSKSFS